MNVEELKRKFLEALISPKIFKGLQAKTILGQHRIYRIIAIKEVIFHEEDIEAVIALVAFSGVHEKFYYIFTGYWDYQISGKPGEEFETIYLERPFEGYFALTEALDKFRKI